MKVGYFLSLGLTAGFDNSVRILARVLISDRTASQNETPTKEAGVSLSKLTGANPSRGNGDGPHTKRQDGGDDARTNRPRHHSSDGDEVRYRRRPVQPLRRRGTQQMRAAALSCLKQLQPRPREIPMFLPC